MRSKILVALSVALGLCAGMLSGQEEAAENEDVRTLVSRLDLEQYKATLKGLTQFGDRRQGTKRNRDAVDWIEAWLKAVGCTDDDFWAIAIPDITVKAAANAKRKLNFFIITRLHFWGR